MDRDNVLFGSQYLEERYRDVMMACALNLDVEQMAEGDLTPVGDHGSALSGGQQARIALARAVYQVMRQTSTVSGTASGTECQANCTGLESGMPQVLFLN